jgi:hypothetical protein
MMEDWIMGRWELLEVGIRNIRLLYSVTHNATKRSATTAVETRPASARRRNCYSYPCRADRPDYNCPGQHFPVNEYDQPLGRRTCHITLVPYEEHPAVSVVYVDSEHIVRGVN